MNIGQYKEYLDNAYESYSKINTLVTTDNKRLLKDIYQPLTLQEEPRHKSLSTIKIDGIPTEFEKVGKKVLIVDRAGMGKSTLVKRMFIDAYEKQIYLPLFIELRRISINSTLLSFIHTMLCAEVPQELLVKDLKEGGFFVILDGFDEVQNDYRAQLLADVKNFTKQFDNNIYIVTSRPEDTFQQLSEFDAYSIRPLQKSESYELLRKHDIDEHISDLLIKKLKELGNKDILEFLKTPLLVSLLYAAFNYKHTIPLKKHIFYEQVFDAFFERHDLTKEGGYVHEKESELDIYDFERVLRIIGFYCMKSQVVEFNINQLTKIVDESKRYLPDLSFSSSSFVNDLLHSVPLFCMDGPYMKWVHKSMQEFYAARFIYIDSKTEQDSILTAIYNSSKLTSYFNVLDIYYDIDNYGFHKNITLPLLSEFIKYYERTYSSMPHINDKLIEERVCLMFMRKASIGYMQNAGSPDEVFNYMSSWCNNSNFKMNNMHAFDVSGIKFCVANNNNPRLQLLELIRGKMPWLFNNTSPIFLKSIPSGYLDKGNRIINGIWDDAENEEMYRFTNYCLMHSTIIYNNYLIYSKAKEEKERIESIITAKGSSSLLSGL
jgi:hypothetical protein